MVHIWLLVLEQPILFSVDNFSCKEVGNLSGPAQGIIDGQSIARNGETEFEVII
jgi:hypothetical protein